MLMIFGAYFILMSPQARGWIGNAAVGLLCGAAFWLKYNAAPFFPVLTLLPTWIGAILMTGHGAFV